MTVQLKILLLLLFIVATFVGGLVTLRMAETHKFRAIAEERARERNRIFDDFLRERGDGLTVLVEEWTILDDMVRAIVKGDRAWAEENFGDATLATHNANALWIYRPDSTLFYAHDNRYAPEELGSLPVTPEAFAQLFATKRTAHFFVRVPKGWMEIRGATVHPSRDSFRETTPQGYFFAGHFWIDENIRQMSLFTGYDIRIGAAETGIAQVPSAEEQGLIRFTRMMPGWDGKPVAQIHVENDSPIIRELNRASRRLFFWLMIFAGCLFVILAASLSLWVRRPLRIIARNLEQENPAGFEPLMRQQNEFGKLARLILNFRSTEQRLHKAEEELRHSQKLEAVGRLAGGIAHDFNNLLTAIIGYSELLEQRFQNDGISLEHAQLIRKAGEQAAGLTRQLLAFSRKQLLLPKVLDLNQLVTDMEKLLQRVIGEHIRIVIQLRATDARVLADPNQLEQVILNLGVNARDAMPSGGTLTITTEITIIGAPEAAVAELEPGEHVLLAVSDTGTGMDDETRAHIFEPFFTTKGPGRGTGLGLATVYGIVKQSRGGITVISRPGAGTTFQVALPREQAAVEIVNQEPPRVPPSINAERILVVEDEEVVRLLVCAMLSEAGYKVNCSATPDEAIEWVKAHDGKIDLLVTDVVMPGMHGPLLARTLAPMQPEMRVLFVSGYSENDISDQGVLDPDLKVLQKPFTQQALLRKVRELLESSRPAVITE
jgi:signal transduction histidine kinase/ActR/RegA family two-component response regulator